MRIGLFIIFLFLSPRVFAGQSWSTLPCQNHRIYLGWMQAREELTGEQSLELDAAQAFICASVPKGDDFDRRCHDFWRQKYDDECSPNE